MYLQYFIQHCFVCRPSDSAVSEDAGIKPRTVTTLELAVRHTNHWARSLHFDIYKYVYPDLEFVVRSAVMVGVEYVQVGLPHVLHNRFYFTTLKVVLVLTDDKIAETCYAFFFLSL